MTTLLPELLDLPDTIDFKALEALNLILPITLLPEIELEPDSPELPESQHEKKDQKIKTFSQECHQHLRGYQTLQELREKTSQFRRGYLNWRKFKPYGARGEAADIISGRKAVRTGSMSRLRDDQEELIVLRKESKISLMSPEKAELIDVPKTIKDEEAWLRFYFNPFIPAEEKIAYPLNAENLEIIGTAPGKTISIPKYSRDKSTVTDWIIHLGVGQFHRSHQLVFIDDLLQAEFVSAEAMVRTSGPTLADTKLLDSSVEDDTTVTSLREDFESDGFSTKAKWGYCGIGFMPFDKRLTDCLREQNLLYTVLSRGNTSSSARVIGSMFDYIFAPEETEEAFGKLQDPNLKIISLTVTEKGYCQNVNGELDLENENVKSDLELLKQPVRSQCPKTAVHNCQKKMKRIHRNNLQGFPSQCPRTAIGFLCFGLFLRRFYKIPPFTVMSCDNLPENGHVAKRMVLQFAKCLDPDLSHWIATNVAFPSTMVDRITPMTVLEHKEILAKDFGIADRWPVVAEDYRQWVIEDNFPTGRPKWENVGALICSDVRPFELMKLRLLNGGHSMVCYVSYLAGYQFVDDAVNDVLISSFLRAYMDEFTSTIKNVSIELERYKEKIVERFGNRMIKDTLLRICEDGSTKFYNTIKDALLELIEEKRHIHWASLGIAAWICFLGTAPTDSIKDGMKERLMVLAKAAVENPKKLIHIQNFLENVFGTQLGSDVLFINHVDSLELVSLAVFTLKMTSVHHVLASGGVLEALFINHLGRSGDMHKLIDFARI